MELKKQNIVLPALKLQNDTYANVSDTHSLCNIVYIALHLRDLLPILALESLRADDIQQYQFPWVKFVIALFGLKSHWWKSYSWKHFFPGHQHKIKDI